MPDLSHLWNRFMLASALVFGLLLGVVTTVFGYSNTSSVDVSWSVFHLNAVPLWSVAVVPLVVVLVTGTIYHWVNSFHHFTEHMRHRHRVHELEAEVTRLRGHLDHVLDMPGEAPSKAAEAAALDVHETTSNAPALPEAATSNGTDKHVRRPAHRKKVTVESGTVAAPPEAAAEKPAGENQVEEPSEPAATAAASPVSTPATADV